MLSFPKTQWAVIGSQPGQHRDIIPSARTSPRMDSKSESAAVVVVAIARVYAARP